MDQFQFFHLCDHKFQITDDDGQVREILIVNNGTQVDILADRSRILDIIEVKVVEYEPIVPPLDFFYDNDDREQDYEDVDSMDGYYDAESSFLADYSKYFVNVDGVQTAIPLPPEFYTAYLHNRILWNVKPPTSYIAKVRMIFSQNQYKQLQLPECPRCQGHAWFVDIFNQDGIFEMAQGIEKVAQRIVKDLMTVTGSNRLDLTDGTAMAKQLAYRSGTTSDDTIFDDIRLIVSEVEDRYLSRQGLDTTLAPEETLVRLYCASAFRDPNAALHIIVELSIQTKAEVRNLRIPIF